MIRDNHYSLGFHSSLHFEINVIFKFQMIHFYDVEQCLDGGEGRCYQLNRGHEKLQLVAYGENIALLTKQQAVIKLANFFLTFKKYF